MTWSSELARLHFLRGNLYFPRGRIEDCLAEHQQSLELARRCGSPELEAQALGGLGDAEYARGRMLTAYRHFRACVELCRRHGFGRIEVANRPMAAITAIYTCDLAGAWAEGLEALAAADRVGHQRAAIIACHGVFFCAMSARAISAAAERVRRARVSTWRGASAPGASRPKRCDSWRTSRWQAGDRADGVALLREALAISRESGIAFHRADAARHARALHRRPAGAARGAGRGRGPARGGLDQPQLPLVLSRRDRDRAGRPATGARSSATPRRSRATPAPSRCPGPSSIVARGRALAACGRGARDAATLAELQRLRAHAERARSAQLCCRRSRRRSREPRDPASASGSKSSDAHSGDRGRRRGRRVSRQGPARERPRRRGRRRTGATACCRPPATAFDVLIVDRMLPGLDGLSLVRHLRATGNTTPVLFLSALGEVDDRVKGLRAGGDDYLVKPYAFSELLARVENLGRRRSAAPVATRLKVADLELDLLTRKVTRAGKRDRPAAARVPAARGAAAPSRPGDDPHDAAGDGLGLPLRSADQRDRRPHQPPAPEDRSRLRACR